jgi:hypothetical protein
MILQFLQGGIGQGSYYYPVMLQFTFVLLVIYFIFKEYREKGLLVCGLANLLYEILKTVFYE